MVAFNQKAFNQKGLVEPKMVGLYSSITRFTTDSEYWLSGTHSHAIYF